MKNGDRIVSPDRRSKLIGIAVLALVSLTTVLNPILIGCTPAQVAEQSIADLPTFRIEQELRIDGHLATLVSIRWMGVAGDGTIAVLQGQDSGVRFFDSSGNDLGLVGRKGEGPGEFQWPAQAGWIGDTLWVNDFMLKRF